MRFRPEVRRVIYTTNALESVNARLRKIIKTRGHFPTDEAATKLIWLALRNITATWVRGAPATWRLAMNQFAILYEDRFTAPIGVDMPRTDAHGRCRPRGRPDRAHREPPAGGELPSRTGLLSEQFACLHQIPSVRLRVPVPPCVFFPCPPPPQ